jgi:Ca2+/Na+ antiporter
MALTTVELYGILSPLVSMILIAAIMAAYVTLTIASPAFIQRAARLFGVEGQLCQTVTDANRDAKKPKTSRRPSYADILAILPSLVCIILASVGLVRSARVLGDAWKIPMAVLGTLILAGLTSIPNIVTAVQLALRGRGSAVLSESLSNTLNPIAGVSLPALILGRISLNPRSVLSLWWLAGMTLLALGLTFVRGGLGRKSGVWLVLVYIVFALLMVFTR